MSNRRDFLGQSAMWAAGLVVLRPTQRILPLTRAVRRTRPRDWLPDPTDPGQMRTLATQAIEAAKQAGAQFADIRLAEWRTMRGSGLDWQVGYGIRTLVNGTWGFAYGQELTADAMTAVARDATGIAKGYAAMNAAVHAAPIELAPIPAVTGEWISPVDISPFDVPVDDHQRLEAHFGYVPRALYQTECFCDFSWEESTRVFASTEGALATQYLTRGDLRIEVESEFKGRYEGALVPSVMPVTGGFEFLLAPDIPTTILEVAHEVIRRSELPLHRFDDEGRFPVVLDGASVGQQVGVCFGGLLDGDRLSGREADASGTTYLQPSADVLAATEPAFSPLITVHADRAVPQAIAQKWDDEGMETGATTLIEQGHVRRYLVGRDMGGVNPAGALLGCVASPRADQKPLVGGTHLTLAPSKTEVGTSVKDLTRNITHGFLIRAAHTQLAPSQLTGVISGAVYEIKQGQEIARVPNIQVLFQTRRWWNAQLKTLGNDSTVMTTQVGTNKGMPWQQVKTVATAPAALFSDADIARIDVKLS